MPHENEKPNAVERFNKTSSVWITFFRNLKVIVVAVVAVVAFTIGMLSEGGRDTIRRLYCRLGGVGVECAEYAPIADRFDPAMLVTQDVIKENEGIAAEWSEFRVHVISEDEKNIRWERGDKSLTYHLKNVNGVWVCNPVD